VLPFFGWVMALPFPWPGASGGTVALRRLKKIRSSGQMIFSSEQLIF
jgi:hypothetical protein